VALAPAWSQAARALSVDRVATTLRSRQPSPQNTRTNMWVQGTVWAAEVPSPTATRARHHTAMCCGLECAQLERTTVCAIASRASITVPSQTEYGPARQRACREGARESATPRVQSEHRLCRERGRCNLGRSRECCLVERMLLPRTLRPLCEPRQQPPPCRPPTARAVHTRQGQMARAHAAASCTAWAKTNEPRAPLQAPLQSSTVRCGGTAAAGRRRAAGGGDEPHRRLAGLTVASWTPSAGHQRTAPSGSG